MRNALNRFLLAATTMLLAFAANSAFALSDFEGVASDGRRYVICTYRGLNADDQMIVEFKGMKRYYSLNRDSQLHDEGRSIIRGDLSKLVGKRVNIYHNGRYVLDARFAKALNK